MLVVLTTHPIQYQVPLWQALAADGRVPFEVWYLTDHGVRVTRDKDFGQNFAWDIAMLEGYPHRFLKVNPDWEMDLARPHGIRLAEPLGPLLRERGATHLLVTGWHKLAFWQAVLQARRAGVKIWLRGESNDLAPLPAWKKFARGRLHREIFRRVDRFLYIGSGNRRLYEKGGVPRSRLSPALYCVDNARFARQAAALRGQRAELRRQWGIPEGAFCVLFCGKFVPMKRPLDVVAAAERLRTVEPALAVHLLFVGSGELCGELRVRCNVAFDAAPGSAPSPAGLSASAASSAQKPAASFAGFLNQTEISRAYVAADILVLPSNHGETWGLVVNEAMASGLPCAASEAVGCSEDLVAPVNPRLRFPLGDIGALAAALQEVAGNPPPADLLTAHIQKHDLGVTVNTVCALWAEQLSTRVPSERSLI